MPARPNGVTSSRRPARGLENEVFLNLLRTADALLRDVEQILKAVELSHPQNVILRVREFDCLEDLLDIAQQGIGSPQQVQENFVFQAAGGPPGARYAVGPRWHWPIILVSTTIVNTGLGSSLRFSAPFTIWQRTPGNGAARTWRQERAGLRFLRGAN